MQSLATSEQKNTGTLAMMPGLSADVDPLLFGACKSCTLAACKSAVLPVKSNREREQKNDPGERLPPKRNRVPPD